MNAVPMIRRCLLRQHPECRGEPPIDPPLLPPEMYDRACFTWSDVNIPQEAMGNGERLPNPEVWL